jgi:predicted phosphodiesterase
MKFSMAIGGIIVALMTFIGSGAVSAGSGRGITFAVFSDPHLFHASLGTEGPAFEAYLNQDRKLIRESEAILDAAIAAIIREKRVQFVLVPGDLTKDGERFNHFLFALKMRKLQAAGIQVFVVPGNHDVSNPHAFRYAGDQEISVPNVSPELFPWIYRHCGYGRAVARDPHSLSYVAEPAKGLWLIAMDACRYDDNETNGTPATEGRFRPQTLDWVLKMIRLGQARGKQLIGMMHHGILEHYAGQSVLFPEYVVADWESVAKQLAEAGLEVVFTGHYHANDATRRTMEGGSSLLDIETGSLVTFPNPFRVVTLRPGGPLDVDSRFITRINYDTGGLTFPEYSERFLTEGLVGIAYAMLQMQYGLLDGEPTLTYARQLAEAFKAHYAGDESPSAETLALIDAYLKSGNPIGVLLGQYLGALWTDLPPEDTALDVDPAGGAAAMAVGE